MPINTLSVTLIGSKLTDIRNRVNETISLHSNCQITKEAYLGELAEILSALNETHSNNIEIFNSVPTLERKYNNLQETICRHYEVTKSYLAKEQDSLCQ